MMEVLDERLVCLLRVVIPSSELLKQPKQEPVDEDISDLLDFNLEDTTDTNEDSLVNNEASSIDSEDSLVNNEDTTNTKEASLVNNEDITNTNEDSLVSEEEEILPQGEMFAIDVDDLNDESISAYQDDNNQPQVDIINKEQSDIEITETEYIDKGKEIISDQEELITSEEEAFDINNDDLVNNNDEFNNLVEESVLEQDTLNLTPARESIFNDDVSNIYEEDIKDDSALIGTIIGSALDDIEAMIGKTDEEPEQESEELLINRKYLESEILKEEIQIGSVKVAKKTMFDFTYDTNSEINIEIDNDWFENDDEEEPVQQTPVSKKKKFSLFGKRKG